MVRAIPILAAAVMCAACAGHDQQSGGVAAPTATPAGIVDRLNHEINAAFAEPKLISAPRLTDANVIGEPQPVTAAQVTGANAVGDQQPVPNTLCARIAATAANFELRCEPKDGNQ
jgi:hypothetical protein